MGWRRTGWGLAVGLAAATLAAARAEARVFDLLPVAGGGWTLIDRMTVEAIPGSDSRKTWIVTVRRNILSSGPPEPGYVRTLTEYDCALKETRWRQVQVFSQTGQQLVTQVNPSAAWRAAAMTPEGTNGLRVVCGLGHGDSVVTADSMGAVVIALLGSFASAPGAVVSQPATPAPVTPGPPASKAAAKPAPKPAAKPPAAPAKTPKPPAKKT